MAFGDVKQTEAEVFWIGELMLDETLLNGLALIEVLGKSERPRGVTDLSRQLHLSKTSTHRLLQTLVNKNFACKDSASGGYKLTIRLWEIGAQIISRADFKKLGGFQLRSLADQTSESAHMTVLDGSEVIYIDKIDSQHPLRTFSHIGGRAPAHCVATGKAQLAHKSDSYIYELGDLKAYTRRTITSHAGLARQLAQVRLLGYAVNRCEWRDDICSIGAAIRDSNGDIVAGIGISGPISRLTVSAQKRFGKLVAEAAANISREMGCGIA